MRSYVPGVYFSQTVQPSSFEKLWEVLERTWGVLAPWENFESFRVRNAISLAFWDNWISVKNVR